MFAKKTRTGLSLLISMQIKKKYKNAPYRRFLVESSSKLEIKK